ncbi:MAG: DUF6318 family protein [Mycobacteriales bacterium]
MRTWTRILLVSVVVVLALAGCSGKSHTAKPHLSSSPSSQPAAPKAPAAASAHTQEGAVAFARYWLGKLLPYTFSSLDSSQLHATSLPSCTTCQNVINSVEAVRKDGQKYVGNDITILDAQSPPVANSQSQTVDVTYRAPAQQIVDKAGKTVSTDPASDHAVSELTLDWDSGHWMVHEVKLLGS